MPCVRQKWHWRGIDALTLQDLLPRGGDPGLFFGGGPGINRRGKPHGTAVLRMTRAAVVALPRVFDHHLPIRFDLVGARVADLGPLDLVFAQAGHDVPLKGSKVRRVFCQVHKQESRHLPAVGFSQPEA